MKKILIIMVAGLSLVACKKEAEVMTVPKLKPAVAQSVGTDTIPDKGVFKIKLRKDSVITDETSFFFDHSSGLNYSSIVDAAYFVGFGQVNLASVTKDNIDLAIYSLPYCSGMSIALDVRTKTDGAYDLEMSYANKIPSTVHIWVVDNYLKDSTDVCSQPYDFKVTKADTNSWGKKRFKLILRDLPSKN